MKRKEEGREERRLTRREGKGTTAERGEEKRLDVRQGRSGTRKRRQKRQLDKEGVKEC